MEKKRLKDIKVRTFECIRDNLIIRGSEYKPAGTNLPIAIVSHGFMGYQDKVRLYAIELAKLGYVSYCFDFCGGSVDKGKSDGKTTDMSVLSEVKDLKVVINYAKSRTYTSNEIVLMGCSQGGFVSAITAAHLKEEISKLILFYPALCIPDDARKGQMMFAKFDPSNIPDIIQCGPMKLGKCYVEDVINMDPYDEIREYKVKVLLVHGTKDKIVDLLYAINASQIYNDIVFKIIEGAGHSFSIKQNKLAIKYIKDFIMQ